MREWLVSFANRHSGRARGDSQPSACLVLDRKSVGWRIKHVIGLTVNLLHPQRSQIYPCGTIYCVCYTWYAREGGSHATTDVYPHPWRRQTYGAGALVAWHPELG